MPWPPAWRPWVPTRVIKCRVCKSIWRNSFRSSGSTGISGHQAPSPSSESSLGWRGLGVEEGTTKPQSYLPVPSKQLPSAEERQQAGSPVQMDFLGSPYQSDCHHSTHLWSVPSSWGTMKPRKTVTTRELEAFRWHGAFISHPDLVISREVPCSETLPTLYSPLSYFTILTPSPHFQSQHNKANHSLPGYQVIRVEREES